MNKFVRISVMCLVILLGLASSSFAAANSVVAAGGAIGGGGTTGFAYDTSNSQEIQFTISGGLGEVDICRAGRIDGYEANIESLGF